MKTIEEIRHDNLMRLLDDLERAGERGPIQKLADILGKSHAQVSQWKTRAKRSGTGKPSNIDSDSARHIEEKCGKPRGWMDNDHGSLQIPPDVLEMAHRLKGFSDDVRDLADHLMRISDPVTREQAVSRAYFAAFRPQRQAVQQAEALPTQAPDPAPAAQR